MAVKKVGFDKFLGSQSNQGQSFSDDEMLRWLEFNAEELCNHARRSGSYKDRTRNLRGSIGYRIIKDGKRMNDGGFNSNDSEEGIENAIAALDRYCEENTIPMVGWCIILVAGMSYAVYVEARGFNVLHETELELQKVVEETKKEFGIQ